MTSACGYVSHTSDGRRSSGGTSSRIERGSGRSTTESSIPQGITVSRSGMSYASASAKSRPEASRGNYANLGVKSGESGRRGRDLAEEMLISCWVVSYVVQT